MLVERCYLAVYVSEFFVFGNFYEVVVEIVPGSEEDVMGGFCGTVF